MTRHRIAAAAPSHHQHRSIARVDRATSIDLTLCLRGRDRGSRENLADTLSAAPIGARRHLDAAELARRFGGDAETQDTVVGWLETAGLQVTECDSARWWITARGPVEAVESAFEVEIHKAHHGGGSIRLHHGDPTVPNSLRGAVRAVLGLDSLPVAQPQASVHQRHAAELTEPAAVANAYRFPATTGVGRAIGIISLGGGFNQEDLESFFAARGMPTPSISVHGIAGATNQPAPPEAIAAALEAAGAVHDHVRLQQHSEGAPTHPSTSAIAWTVETTMDLELAGVFAPGADLHLYVAPNTTRGKYHALRQAIDDGMTVISMSWSGHENDKTRTYLQEIEHLFTLAAIRGVTACASSGDDGLLAYPASSPRVLAVGGTHLVLSDARRSHETTWNEALHTPRDRRMCSGGGVSRVFAQPAWQASAAISAKTGYSGRGVPDVAAKADIATGFPITVGGVIMGGGGTSAAAPLWAALIARCAEGLDDCATPGCLNAALYAEPSACHSITQGHIGQFSAGEGWDPCTGLGAPDGETLARLFTNRDH